MRVFVVKDEKDAADLRRSLLKPGVPASRAKAVEDSVRAANPHVDIGRLRPGTVLVIPDQDDLGDAAGPPGHRGADVDAASAALPVAAAAARRGATESAKNTETLRKALQVREVRAATETDERLRGEVDRLTGALTEEQQRTDEWAQALAAQTERWQAALARLKRVV
jgi:hypothetical protein